MNGRFSISIVAVFLLIWGGWYLLSKTPTNAPTSTTAETQKIQETTTPPAGVTVTYTDQGFSPASITVSQGATVTFVNQSSGKMWVASAAHPSHTVYSGTSVSEHCPDTANTAFDECTADAPGSSFAFTFNKEGTWKYHNHVNASQFGTVIVTAPL